MFRKEISNFLEQKEKSVIYIGSSNKNIDMYSEALKEKNIDIIELANIQEEELDSFIKLSGEPAKKFFNTSGIFYREMNLKDKLTSATYDEMLEILSSDGMLVKRPLIISDKGVLIGFEIENLVEFAEKMNSLIK